MNYELKDIQWGEYRIGDLFEKIKTNNIYKNVEPGDLPATTALLTNNQIGRYVNRKNATILKNVFSATANGTGRAFYQPYDFTVLQDSYAFKFKDKKINIKNIHPFIVCVLNTVYAKYDWGNKSGWEKVKNDFIKLPTKNNQIDFDFMEKYISLIKQESLNKLKEYLNKQTNNNYYYLSTLEQDAINNFNDITWKEYRIGDLFESENGDFDIQKSHINNNGYFVITSGLMNNGILGKSDVLSKIFREQTITVDMFGNVFYRSFKYKLVTRKSIFFNTQIYNNRKCWSIFPVFPTCV
ncbi:restriction endonuclease subunit S [Mycoplasmopsis felis]|uniref:restriction endonuclease subunit S n=1 Tax=Mycoplasmopsis felis TaxID=33923 RepID=UPI0022857E21|nr:restriction endonuclease subunit S [Mycoplasmopsis felis]WAM01839.1 restriction endonuclease subunit S [Mycoplasmopsis felis]